MVGTGANREDGSAGSEGSGALGWSWFLDAEVRDPTGDDPEADERDLLLPSLLLALVAGVAAAGLALSALYLTRPGP